MTNLFKALMQAAQQHHQRRQQRRQQQQWAAPDVLISVPIDCLINDVIQAIVSIFSWPFDEEVGAYVKSLHALVRGQSRRDQALQVRPPESWCRFLIDSPLLELLLQSHALFVAVNTPNHRIREAVILLASLRGKVFPLKRQPTITEDWVHRLMSGLLRVWDSPDNPLSSAHQDFSGAFGAQSSGKPPPTMWQEEALWLSRVLKRVADNFGVNTLLQLPSRDAMLNGCLGLCVMLAKQPARGLDAWHLDPLCLMLSLWATLAVQAGREERATQRVISKMCLSAIAAVVQTSTICIAIAHAASITPISLDDDDDDDDEYDDGADDGEDERARKGEIGGDAGGPAQMLAHLAVMARTDTLSSVALLLSVLRQRSASSQRRPSGQWASSDYDVIAGLLLILGHVVAVPDAPDIVANPLLADVKAPRIGGGPYRGIDGLEYCFGIPLEARIVLRNSGQDNQTTNCLTSLLGIVIELSSLPLSPPEASATTFDPLSPLKNPATDDPQSQRQHSGTDRQQPACALPPDQAREQANKQLANAALLDSVGRLQRVVVWSLAGLAVCFVLPAGRHRAMCPFPDDYMFRVGTAHGIGTWGSCFNAILSNLAWAHKHSLKAKIPGRAGTGRSGGGHAVAASVADACCRAALSCLSHENCSGRAQNLSQTPLWSLVESITLCKDALPRGISLLPNFSRRAVVKQLACACISVWGRSPQSARFMTAFFTSMDLKLQYLSSLASSPQELRHHPQQHAHFDIAMDLLLGAAAAGARLRPQQRGVLSATLCPRIPLLVQTIRGLEQQQGQVPNPSKQCKSPSSSLCVLLSLLVRMVSPNQIPHLAILMVNSSSTPRKRTALDEVTSLACACRMWRTLLSVVSAQLESQETKVDVWVGVMGRCLEALHAINARVLLARAFPSVILPYLHVLCLVVGQQGTHKAKTRAPGIELLLSLPPHVRSGFEQVLHTAVQVSQPPRVRTLGVRVFEVLRGQ